MWNNADGKSIDNLIPKIFDSLEIKPNFSENQATNLKYMRVRKIIEKLYKI